MGELQPYAGGRPLHLVLTYLLLQLLHFFLKLLGRIYRTTGRLIRSGLRLQGPSGERALGRLEHVAISGEFRREEVGALGQVAGWAASEGAEWVTVHDRGGALEAAGEPPGATVGLARPEAAKRALVRYAQALAGRAPAERGVDAGDPDALVRWLDRDPRRWLLPSEPDLVLVFPAREGGTLRSLSGFGVWQARLTQIFFAERGIQAFTYDEFREVILTYGKTPKRFGK